MTLLSDIFGVLMMLILMIALNSAEHSMKIVILVVFVSNLHL